MLCEIFHRLAVNRARGLAARLSPHLPSSGRVLDLGSGTGHNITAFAEVRSLRFVEADVADIHVVGPGPTLFDGERLPFADSAFQGAVACFVLQYAARPEQLLRELHRVTAGPAILIQSTYDGVRALTRLRLREAVTGRWAQAAARWARFIPSNGTRLVPVRHWTRPELRALIERSGFRITRWEPETPGRLSRDLYILERA